MGELDAEGRALTAVLSLWDGAIGVEPISASDLLAKLTAHSGPSSEPPFSSPGITEAEQAFREALTTLGHIAKWPPSNIRIGRILAAHCGRAMAAERSDGSAEVVVLRSDYSSDRKVNRYFVERLESSERRTESTGSTGSTGSCPVSPRVRAPAHAHARTHTPAHDDRPGQLPVLPVLPVNGEAIEEGTL
jgi:hypothetical protein